ncbi:cytochrome c peroxidase [Lasallia pustulata]|uniref:Peroxidase n=1 Tax=Lasallia pustulata TaxID=136370 RepID=A0A1W5CZI6_9LECA|nr:cytochrome c peroxidase [Lasallia pustulata]
MASAARSFTRLASRATPAASTVKTSATRNARFALPRQTFQSSSRRAYASEASPKSSKTGLYVGLGLVLAGGAGAYFYANNGGVGNMKEGSAGETRGLFTPTKDDYQKVYNLIASRLEEKDDYDDGSYGPVLVRLAWHCSGTYDKETNTGGSNGATMRFAPEGDHGANAGLKAARDFLQPQFPWITYSDLWTLAGVCAIQEMQGPVIPWRPGRKDRDVSMCTPDGRLPDGSKEHDHLRAIFGRMGFDDREIVALSGAHALGRCHTDRSGFEGPWTFSPTVMSNDYYRLLLEDKWNFRKWDGPKQYEDKTSKSLMMLPTDMALIKDKAFRKHVERYAKDDQVFFSEFRDVIVKLFELGVPFTSKEEDRMELKPAA